MTDRRMAVFQAAAESNSFTKAAEHLYMSQPAVTFQIKQLEEELGMTVFNRCRNSIEITEAGKIALKCAERVQDAYTKMREEIAILQGTPKPKGWKPGTQVEADAFRANHCATCTKRPKTFGVSCIIWQTAKVYSVGESKYPTEWQYTDEGRPVCTAYAESEELT